MSGRRILVVDDDAGVRESLSALLTANGYRVEVASDGREGARRALATTPDLVLTDLAMPGGDGFELIEALRRRGATPVIVLSVRGDEVDKVRALDLGADDYVTKPFSLPEFEARVRALIRRSQAVHSPVLSFGRLTLHTVSKRAQIDGEDVELTPREWGVLEYLLMRAGQVVSKEQMLQALCGWDASLTHNTIEVYVSRLRAKLQRADIRIRTVRGFGYMVDDPDAGSRQS